jgi:hypothetical protein
MLQKNIPVPVQSLPPVKKNIPVQSLPPVLILTVTAIYYAVQVPRHRYATISIEILHNIIKTFKHRVKYIAVT